MNEQVIIVTGGGYEAEFAIKLHNLLAERKVESALWTEKEFEQNSPQVLNTQRKIFFGLGKIAQKQAKGISKWSYDLYGCKIGTIGNVCVITAKESWLGGKEIPQFIFRCKERATAHPDIVVPNVANNPLEFIKGKFDKDDNTIRRAQYSLLVYEFIDNWLDGFIGVRQDEE